MSEKVIVKPHWHGGFFSQFNKVITVLYLESKGKRRPVIVDWDEGTEWFEFEGNCPAQGLWSCFFEPLGGNTDHNDNVGMETVDEYPYFTGPEFPYTLSWRDFSWKAVPTANHACLAYLFSRGWRKQYHKIYKDNIRIRPSILERVDSFYEKFIRGYFCVGIQIRSAGHSYEEMGRVGLGVDRYIKSAKKRVKNKKYRIFLATDSNEILETFKEVFGDKVIYQQEVDRLAKDVNAGGPHEIKKQTILDGELVISDALILSKCDVLIHSVSNIATAVGYINPQLPMIYMYSYRGLYREFLSISRKMLKSLIHNFAKNKVIMF